MLSKVRSGAVYGIDAYLVHVETYMEGNVPFFGIVGLKEGCAYDLPIAIGILVAQGEISEEKLEDILLLGELALDGTVRPVHGVLPVVIEALKQGIHSIIVPEGNAKEAAVTGEKIKVYPIVSLLDAVNFLNNILSLEPYTISLEEVFKQQQNYAVDFRDVKGQQHVKRALEVAAAGGHNIIMIGPPGSGKTMLVKRFPTILPTMTLEESLETTKIHSVAGLLPTQCALVTSRLFRSPHLTVTEAIVLPAKLEISVYS